MAEETIKQYQKDYKFEDKDIIWAHTANANNSKLPTKGKTYFFVQSNGAIYIGKVLQRKGLCVYKTYIETNINNILKVNKNKEADIYIDYKNPENNMIMWAEISNYNSVDNLLDELSTLNLNKEQKKNEFLIKKSLEEDEEDNDSRLIQRNNNRKYQFNPITRIHNRITGSRTGIGGKGRKKTKRNKNKNKKRKTHKKR